MMPPGQDPSSDAAVPSRTSACLLGRDHEERGSVATDSVRGRAALGLARGWAPKPYPYVDPNEDAVGCAVGARACLLAVADGHNGYAASHAALAEVLGRLGGGSLRADLADDDVVAVVTQVDARIAEANAGRPLGSRTTLVVALRTATSLQWVAAGDSSLLVVGTGRSAALPSMTHWFLGDGRLRTGHLRGPARGRIALPPDAWVVLATDGYTDYVPDGLTAPAAAAVALTASDDPERAVLALLDQARRGGAGDNVGVAVCAPWYKRGSGHDDDPGYDG